MSCITVYGCTAAQEVCQVAGHAEKQDIILGTVIAFDISPQCDSVWAQQGSAGLCVDNAQLERLVISRAAI